MGIRVILADDHQIVREGLSALLQKCPDVEVVGEAKDGRCAVEMVRQLLPDVVVMDISMPDMNGIEATYQISREIPNTKVLALSMHSDRRFVEEILKAGASGYLLKDCAREELVHGIRAVVRNRIYLPPAIADTITRNYVRSLSKGDLSAFSILTSRECEVLQLLAEGKTTREIASRLYVSVKTVETHRLQIMDKLDIHSIAGLTKYAIREGVTSLET